MSRRTSFHLVAALGVVAAAIALTVAVARKPAQALPGYKSTCSSCHSGHPSGTVTATPSKATLTPGEAYTRRRRRRPQLLWQAGYWISANDASTPAVSVTGGPGTSPFTANMTAPSAAGTYTYKVWGAKGTPSSGGRHSPPPTRSPSWHQGAVAGRWRHRRHRRPDHRGAERRQGGQGQEGDPEVPGQRRRPQPRHRRPRSSRSRTRPARSSRPSSRAPRPSTSSRRRPSPASSPRARTSSTSPRPTRRATSPPTPPSTS